MKAEDLITGSRYYLDCVKDVSAVYIGRDQNGVFRFNDPIGPDYYRMDDDGTIPFSGNKNYFSPVEYSVPVVTKQELLVRLNDLVNVLDASIAEHGNYLTESITLRLNESRETLNKAI